MIWKAKLLLDGGRMDEAEKTVRAAIAIDPSDGEQGKGDRLRAYAVLADVLEKKGDAAQAKTMRGAVEAIRLSEDADDWWAAGLLSRAITMYEAALGHFADAYCIQSRLALRHAELGDFAKAEEHYRRAYELMPDSFGRVESHCFGCEGAFTGERAQGIADRVFTRLATEAPTKPQIFYLLGYLREQQGRYAEAAAQFQKAVALDPDYLNAWKNLTELNRSVQLPPAVRETAALNLLRLDPLGRHGGGVSGYDGGSFSQIADFRALWPALLEIIRMQPAGGATVFPLPASAAEIERRKQAAGNARSGRFVSNEFGGGEAARAHTPGELLAKHTMVSRLAQMLEQLASN